MIPETKGLLVYYLWDAACRLIDCLTAIRGWSWQKTRLYPMPKWWVQRKLKQYKLNFDMVCK